MYGVGLNPPLIMRLHHAVDSSGNATQKLAAHRIASIELSRSFLTWMATWRAQRTPQRLLRMALIHFARHAQVHGWKSWVEKVRMHQLALRRIRLAGTHFIYFAEVVGWRTWRAKCGARQANLALLRQAGTVLVQHRLARGWRSFDATVRERQRGQQLMHTATSLIVNLEMARGWRSFVYFCEERWQQLERLQVACHALVHHGKVKALNTWAALWLLVIKYEMAEDRAVRQQILRAWNRWARRWRALIKYEISANRAMWKQVVRGMSRFMAVHLVGQLEGKAFWHAFRSSISKAWEQWVNWHKEALLARSRHWSQKLQTPRIAGVRLVLEIKGKGKGKPKQRVPRPHEEGTPIVNPQTSRSVPSSKARSAISAVDASMALGSVRGGRLLAESVALRLNAEAPAVAHASGSAKTPSKVDAFTTPTKTTFKSAASPRPPLAPAPISLAPASSANAHKTSTASTAAAASEQAPPAAATLTNSTATKQEPFWAKVGTWLQTAVTANGSDAGDVNVQDTAAISCLLPSGTIF